MKIFITLLFTAISITSNCQKINSTNYYDYYKETGKSLKSERLFTSWLSKLEVAKIAEEEMKNAGFESISFFRIVQLDDTTYINAICFSENSKVGFLFEGSHKAIPHANSRKIKSMEKEIFGNDYSEKIVKLNGNSKFLKIKDIPKNFFIVKQDPYWYQFTDDHRDEKNLVTKAIITEILRSDIREVLSNFEK